MKRRSFVKAAAIGAALVPAVGNAMKTDPQNTSAQEFYELRVYTLKDAAQQHLVQDYLSKAYIPTLNRLGVMHVGVFTELKPAAYTRLFVLIPYSGLDQFTKVAAALEHDGAYIIQAMPYLNAPATAPAYERIESSLLKAFAHTPKLVLPGTKPRMFELRQYQSAGESAGKKKIEMFNDQGEIDIFKRLGFKPVFFAETLIGGLRPNLTYMVTFDDMAAHDAHWKSFVDDAQWKQISTVPEYADALLVSKITSTYLVPAAFSQV